jgi:hypothetical protein
MTEENMRDHQMALAAIALDNATADGQKPSFEELWDWAAGKISGERATQIQSHVARDGQIYTQWREIRLALQEDSVSDDVRSSTSAVSQRSDSVVTGASATASDRKGAGSSFMETILGWLTPVQLGGGLATAAVLGIAVSIGLNQTKSPPENFWADWQQPKSLQAPAVDEAQSSELQAFLAGMGQQMRALSIPAVDPVGREFPDKVPECVESDDQCEQRREMLSELGQLSVLSKLECMVSDTASPARKQRLQEIVQALESDQVAGRLISPLRSWAAADATADRCGAVSSLISRGLLGIESAGI